MENYYYELDVFTIFIVKPKFGSWMHTNVVASPKGAAIPRVIPGDCFTLLVQGSQRRTYCYFIRICEER